jgi:acetyltransferase-like isoleucine patch superfamily enzyme
VVVADDSITIGAGCTIAEMVVIRDQDHKGIVGSVWRHGEFTTAPIVIGSRVWIGAKATVLKGVRVGDDAVIGAGAVVTSEVEPATIVAGIPAAVIGVRDRD